MYIKETALLMFHGELNKGLLQLIIPRNRDIQWIDFLGIAISNTSGKDDASFIQQDFPLLFFLHIHRNLFPRILKAFRPYLLAQGCADDRGVNAITYNVNDQIWAIKIQSSNNLQQRDKRK